MVTLVYLIKLPNGWLRHIPKMVVDWWVVSSTFHWLWPKSCVGLPWFAMVCLKCDFLPGLDSSALRCAGYALYMHAMNMVAQDSYTLNMVHFQV